MPKRTVEHQLEDQSRTRFKSILPPAWVFRDKSHDYGIDGEIEIFSSDGSSTGLFCFVQLKSTNKKNAPKVTVDLEKYYYYLSLDVPVLIVEWVAPSNQFYFRWMHSVNPRVRSRPSKSFSLRFHSEDRWQKNSSEMILQHLVQLRDFRNRSLDLPLCFGVRFTGESIRGVSNARILSALRLVNTEISDIVIFDDHVEPNSVGEVLIDKEYVSVSINKISQSHFGKLGSRYSWSDLDRAATTKLLAEDIVTSVIVSLGRARQHDLASRLTQVHGACGTLFSRP